jgi:heme-degrading monooxygenase HmoA
MFARVTTWTFEPTPEHAEAFIRRGSDEVMPAARQLPGSRGFLWLVDRDVGRGLTLTLWATREAEQASAQAANQFRAGTSQSTGVTMSGAGRYEVAVVDLEPSLAQPG